MPLPTGEASVAICKGTTISVPTICINRAEAIWGLNAKEFNPERWLVPEEGKEPSKVQWGKAALENTFRQVQGHRHLLTFSDGPRTCLGKGFALVEFKVHSFLYVKFIGLIMLCIGCFICFNQNLCL